MLNITQRAKHFDRKLWQAVAEISELQVVKHDIGETSIGRHIARTLDSFHGAVRHLRFRAQIGAVGNPGQVQQVSIRPDAANAGDGSFAKGDGAGDRIGIAGRFYRTAPTPTSLAAAA